MKKRLLQQIIIFVYIAQDVPCTASSKVDFSLCLFNHSHTVVVFPTVPSPDVSNVTDEYYVHCKCSYCCFCCDAIYYLFRIVFDAVGLAAGRVSGL